MSWASQRRTAYLSGVIGFFVIVIGGPIAYHFLTIPATCFDGKQNQGETAVDKGGPCVLLDERTLQPLSVMWARAFAVRPGIYSAVAYIENPNPNAGAEQVGYHMRFYDSGNVLVGERSGSTFIMPGGITPVLVTGIASGNREIVHTYFEFDDAPIAWVRASNPAADIKVSGQVAQNISASPSVQAQVVNASLDTRRNIKFIAVVFDPAGDAIAGSGTALAELAPSAPTTLTFTWPNAFPSQTGRIDVIPLLPPAVGTTN